MPRTPPGRRRPSSRPRRAASRRAATSSWTSNRSRPRSRARWRRGRGGRGSPGSPTSIRGTGRPKIRAGAADMRSSTRPRSSVSRLDEMGVDRCERGFEPGDAERRLLERLLLLVRGVRRVIGRDAGDRPVDETGEQRLPVVLRPQRRVHLAVGVECAHGFVGQAEVMRRDLRGHGDPALPAHCVPRRRTPAQRDALYAKDGVHMRQGHSRA